MSPFFLSVLKVSTQFSHDADLIGAAYMAKTCNLLPTIATVKQSQLPIFSLLLSFIMFPYVLKNTKYCQKNRHQGALLDEYAAPGGAEDI